MQGKPLCTIVMAVHNGADTIRETVDSMLNQTLQNFEFVIVDDCSTDNSKEILKGYGDARIRIIENHANIGLAASLNRGIDAATTGYIARMDADDIALPGRLDKQYQFMEANPRIGLVGTFAENFGDMSGLRVHSEKSDELKVRTLFSCQFCHPTVMIRKEVLDRNHLRYNEQFRTAQDYELWSRMIEITDFATIPESLLRYRVHQKQVSSAKREEQLSNTGEIYSNILKRLGISVSAADLEMNTALADFSFERTPDKIEEIGKYMLKLIEANQSSAIFPKLYFSNFLAEYFYNICRNSRLSRIERASLYSKSGLGKYFNNNLVTVKLLLA